MLYKQPVYEANAAVKSSVANLKIGTPNVLIEFRHQVKDAHRGTFRWKEKKN